MLHHRNIHLKVGGAWESASSMREAMGVVQKVLWLRAVDNIVMNGFWDEPVNGRSGGSKVKNKTRPVSAT